MTSGPQYPVRNPLPCFLLTRQWRDTAGGLELSFWAASANGPVHIVVTGQEAVCFIERDHADSALVESLSDSGGGRRKPLSLRSLHDRPVDGLYFRHQRDLVACRGRLRASGVWPLESDVKPSDRFLMERFITAGMAVDGDPVIHEGHLEYRNPALRRMSVVPDFRAVSLDIETDGLDGAIYSIALHARDDERVLMVAGEPVETKECTLVRCGGERELLQSLFAWFDQTDPDLILGWNIVNFDLDAIERRCRRLRVPFAIARGSEAAAVLQPQSANGVRVARVPGRVILDGIELLRAGFWSFESFELDHVARELLGRGKRIEPGRDKVAEIRRLYREDKAALAAYNLEDCRLVGEIFERADLLSFAVRRAELTGLGMDRVGGSVAAFDHLYLPRLHRRGRVAPDVGASSGGVGSPGGYVMDSKPGLYQDVLLFDFKSLYPSIIRTFQIDPYGLAIAAGPPQSPEIGESGGDPVPGFLDATFARRGAILPELITDLWVAREEAKRSGDGALSQAVKILMNSFYGVLGASGCRFHDPRLASSITKRGHEIIQRSREFIEASGHPVIYGDTDSLFVHLGDRGDPGDGVSAGFALEIGDRLARELNAWWRTRLLDEHDLESYLEVEFETHFRRFLMPTVRGDSTGSKKRYAGMIRGSDGGYELVFKGLESVRTDWTPLARRFQRELYRRVFLDEPYEDYVKDTLSDMLSGRLDAELVYRKRIRRPLHEYTKNVPPHVQAARKLERPGRWIRYVMTAGGPEPVVDAIPRPDYGHYRERQLAPCADGILHFLDASFESITDDQLSMF